MEIEFLDVPESVQKQIKDRIKERQAKRTKIREIPDGLGSWQDEIRWLQRGRTGNDYQKVVGYEWRVRKLSSEFLATIGIKDRFSEDLFHPDNAIWTEAMDLLTQRVWDYFKNTNKWPIKMLLDQAEVRREA